MSETAGAMVSTRFEDAAPSTSELEVVALILSDGSVVPPAVATGAVLPFPSARQWLSGTVSGKDWTLWWHRRSFAERP